MEVNMEMFFKNIENENINLNESLRKSEEENNHLLEKVSLIEKELEKQKKFHRKYADEVSSTEAIRIADFKKEKHDMAEENKAQTKYISQLVKDLTFYKKIYEELAEEDETKVATVSNSSKSNSSVLNTTRQSKYALRSTSTSGSETNLYRVPLSDCTHKSAKTLMKINKTLFEENKKLKSKIRDMSALLTSLRRKNKQLENFRAAINNKKSKFERDSNELEQLVASSEKTNKDTFTPEVLAMLGNFAKNKK